MLDLDPGQPKRGAPEWVVTFGDMMSLLLVFFVLLLSFSTMEIQKFKVVAGFMREAFGLKTRLNYSGIPMGTTILNTDARDTTTPQIELDLMQQVQEALRQAGLERRASVQVTHKGVSIRLEGEVLFESGEATIQPRAGEILDRIAAIARTQPGSVEIEGHTDDVPIANTRFPSNWELSGARAAAAARYLIERGVPAERIRAIGFADTRPVVPNDTPENRAKNRRVEFVFVRPPAGETRSAPQQPFGGPAAPPQPAKRAREAEGG